MRTDTTEIRATSATTVIDMDLTVPMPRVQNPNAKCARCDIRLNAIAVPPVPYKGRVFHDVCARAERMKDNGVHLGALPSMLPGLSDPR